MDVKAAPLSRFASYPRGDATTGLAKPVPRWPWLCIATVSTAVRGTQSSGTQHL